MANDLTGRQWKIDTASANVIFKGNVKIRNIDFTNYATDADAFVVKDATGRIVWEGNGASDLKPVRSSYIGWVGGLIVSTLTAGAVLLIYIE